MPVTKKRKIVSSKRSAFWPCGSCRRNCTAGSIECEACKRWHHMSCEGLTLSEFKFFDETTASYTCNDCFAIIMGNSPYCYPAALFRLHQWSTTYGIDGVKFAARREQQRLPPFQLYGKESIPSGFVEIDRQAEEIMRRSKLSGVGIPGLSTGDGNCLFNAVSTVLTGDEELAPELRLRTAIEMALNTDKYKKRGDYNDLMACSPSYEESLLAACTDGAYMSVWNMIVLSTVVGKPIQSVYPALNGDKDKTLGYLNKLFKTNENQNRETITVLWSRLGPCRRPSWTPNHFVPILPHSSQQPSKPKTSIITSNEQPSVTSTPKHDPKQPQTTTKVEPEDNITPKAETTLPQNVTIIPMSSPKQVISDLPTATIMGNDGTPFRITQITNILPANDTTMNMELEQSSIACENEVHDDTDERDESTQYDDTEFVVNPPSENMPVQPDSLDNQTNLVTSSNNDDDDESPENMTVDNSEHQHLPDLPVPPTAKPFRQGRWHTADELYSIITNTTDVNEEVPPGDKSNCYMVVNNERNMTKLSSGKNKKCDFYDDCGAWDYTKGNTCKTTYVVTDGSLRHVELKNSQYSTKVRRQGKVHWVPLDPQPADENVVTISRYYATSTTDPNFEKKVSYFVRKTDASLGNIAVYE